MADKKITELPFIDTLSGSLVGDNTPLQNTVIPLVLRGNTNQINIENFSKFVTAYSAHTGSAGNIFTGPQTINNNVIINGRLTVREVVAEYETASILFSTGSTKLGDQITDRHEFTGSTNITGSFIVNGANLTDFSASNSTLFTNYSSSVSQSISSYSSSNSTTFTNLSSSNSTTFTNLSSSNSTTFTNLSSSNSTTFTNYSSSVSQSISSYSSSNSTTFTNLSSSNSTTFTNYSSSVSQSISSYSSSNSTTFTDLSSSNSTTFTNFSSSNAVISQTYSASNSTTFTNYSSSNAVISQTYSASNSTTFTNYSSSTATSINGLSLGIGTELARVYQTTASLNIQTGSQNSLNTSLGLITSSIYSEITSFNSVFQRIGSTTSSMNTQSGSQDLVNLGISSVTGSLIGITNTLMAFTAALDNTYATDAQLYQLYQATSSIQFATRSLNIQTGSQDLVNLGISTYTGSQNIINSSVDSHILKQATQTGSQDLVNLGISTFTGSQNIINNSIDAHILKQATQTGSQDLVNLGISTFTGSLRSEVNLIEAYTASLKGAAIVSSSQQITNYYKFAETASANTFYGDQTITGSLAIKDSETNFLIEGNGFSQTYLTSNGAIVLNPGYGGVEMVGSYRTFKATDITADGFVSASTITGLGNATLYSQSVVSAISASDFGQTLLSASIATTNNTQTDNITTATQAAAGAFASASAYSGSAVTTYAKLSGDNIFNGTQTITGSLFVSSNLVVQGSSSLQNITASAVSIGTNKIILNNDSPAVRYAGIAVFDSGSTNVTASLLYDSLTNNWKFEHTDTGTDDASIVLFGPLGTGIDNAPTLAGNFLTKVENNGHGHHLTTSSIQDTGTLVKVVSATQITGSLGVSGSIGVIGNLTINGTSYAAASSGTSGAQGPQGTNGTIGTNGAQGPTGGAGPTGPQGRQGPTGPNGGTGPTGPTGNPFGGGTFTGGISVQGAITATGDITAYSSDDRLKVRIGNIENALSKVQQLNGFHYTNSDVAKSLGYTTDEQQVGVSAQEVQEVLPEVVVLAPIDRLVLESGEIISKSGENYLTVKYEKIVPLIIEAIKELKAELDELKNK
jgi:hypothetical protein